jgi:hypothetical protein
MRDSNAAPEQIKVVVEKNVIRRLFKNILMQGTRNPEE